MRLLSLLLIILSLSGLLFYLPASIGNTTIKQVDLFSDIRETPQMVNLDSMIQEIEQRDTIRPSYDTIQAIVRSDIDSSQIKQRDSLFNILKKDKGASVTGKQIEDYSDGHIAMKQFFDALNNREQLNRPIRVAFMGDSFIEGDILVSDFRTLLQKRYGENGVGFIPIHSPADPYRASIQYKSIGFHTHQIKPKSKEEFTISGFFFTPDSVISPSIEATVIGPASNYKLLYQNNKRSRISLICNKQDTITIQLPPTDSITEYTLPHKKVQSIHLQFKQTKGLNLLGNIFESPTGVIVDNLSIRGCSGLPFGTLSLSKSKTLRKLRPYDLIILQYGLNIVTDSILVYRWYGYRMKKVIHQLQTCYPKADILILSISDRNHKENGSFKTIPGILSMLHAQRHTARQMKVAFWNLFGAMGGENSMSKFVENQWARKDYTHINRIGGKKLAKRLYQAIINEKKLYDQASEKIQK